MKLGKIFLLFFYLAQASAFAYEFPYAPTGDVDDLNLDLKLITVPIPQAEKILWESANFIGVSDYRYVDLESIYKEVPNLIEKDETYPLDRKEEVLKSTYTHYIPKLTLVVFKGDTGEEIWEQGTVDQDVAILAKTYASCGIRLGDGKDGHAVTVINVEKYKDVIIDEDGEILEGDETNNPDPSTFKGIIKSIPLKFRKLNGYVVPIVVFSTSDGGQGDVAYSRIFESITNDPDSIQSIFISPQANINDLAHETAHLGLNIGTHHLPTEEPSVFNDSKAKRIHLLTKLDCDIIKNNTNGGNLVLPLPETQPINP